MSLSKIFKTDSQAEQKGVPLTFPANDDGTIPTFYIARMHRSNPKYQRALESATKPYKRELQLGTLPDEKAQQLTRSIFIKALLTGWENIPMSDVTGEAVDTLEDGSTVYAPFTEANAEALFANLPELYSDLNVFAQNRQNFIEVEREADAKN